MNFNLIPQHVYLSATEKEICQQPDTQGFHLLPLIRIPENSKEKMDSMAHIKPWRNGERNSYRYNSIRLGPTRAKALPPATARHKRAGQTVIRFSRKNAVAMLHRSRFVCPMILLISTLNQRDCVIFKITS